MDDRSPLVSPDHPALRSVAEYVPTYAEAIDASRKMIEACEKYGGIGLAAPQIGLSWRLIVVSTVPAYRFAGWMVLVDPVITQARGKTESEEGCLSLVGVKVKVPRATLLTVDAMVLQCGKNPIQPPPTKRSTNKFDRLTAITAQHEIDHLNGILIDKYLTAASVG
jgi:peptide deformylase